MDYKWTKAMGAASVKQFIIRDISGKYLIAGQALKTHKPPRITKESTSISCLYPRAFVTALIFKHDAKKNEDQT